jgi:negative regulator of flagellin synthesis FlgM
MQSGQVLKQQGKKAKCGNESPAIRRRKLLRRNREVSNLVELIRSTPDVRENKVEALRKKIQGGTYSIKGEEIAEKIIGDNPLDETP